MGYFIVEAVLFVLGMGIFILGKVPMTRRRSVNGSAAYVVGFILMLPLPLYLLACMRCHVNPLRPDPRNMDPFMPFTEGFVQIAAMAAALGCGLAALVLAVIASEKKRPEDMAPRTRR